MTDKRGYASVDDFVTQEMEWMFNGYSWCLVQGQAKHIEVPALMETDPFMLIKKEPGSAQQ